MGLCFFWIVNSYDNSSPFFCSSFRASSLDVSVFATHAAPFQSIIVTILLGAITIFIILNPLDIVYSWSTKLIGLNIDHISLIKLHRIISL